MTGARSTSIARVMRPWPVSSTTGTDAGSGSGWAAAGAASANSIARIKRRIIGGKIQLLALGALRSASRPAENRMLPTINAASPARKAIS